jgi:hypothetical protein
MTSFQNVQKNILHALGYPSAVMQTGWTMRTIAFRSSDPLDHVCRALDAIRKMSIQITSLRVDGEADGGFHICIKFDGQDGLTAGTLFERVSSCIGVYDLTSSDDGETARG